MPRARDDFRLPPDLYADNLKNVGLDIPPDALIAKAELAYAEIRNEMRAIAPLVAKQHNLEVTDYRDVIRALKKNQIARDRVEPHLPGHHQADRGHHPPRAHRVAARARDADARRLRSRNGGAARAAHGSAALIGNKGERGTFVLTMGNPSTSGKPAESYDDFNHEAGTWTLTAHEGRPGHELQFSAMVERGVSLARSVFAFNSVNVEGWALYAEAETKPFEPLDGQLFALQARLQRAARAILDPMINLGRISKERAMEVLTEEVVLSPAYARQEVDRYTFRAPGQATQLLLRLHQAHGTARGNRDRARQEIQPPGVQRFRDRPGPAAADAAARSGAEGIHSRADGQISERGSINRPRTAPRTATPRRTAGCSLPSRTRATARD